MCKSSMRLRDISRYLRVEAHLTIYGGISKRRLLLIEKYSSEIESNKRGLTVLIRFVSSLSTLKLDNPKISCGISLNLLNDKSTICKF